MSQILWETRCASGSSGLCMDCETARVRRFDPGIVGELIVSIRRKDHLPVVSGWMTDEVLRLVGNDAAGKAGYRGLLFELKQSSAKYRV